MPAEIEGQKKFFVRVAGVSSRDILKEITQRAEVAFKCSRQLPGQRSALAFELAGLQPGQPVAPPRAAEGGQRPVVDKPPAASGENGRATDQARQVLVVDVGRGASAPALVWPDVAADLGAASSRTGSAPIAIAECGAQVGGTKQYLRRR